MITFITVWESFGLCIKHNACNCGSVSRPLTIQHEPYCALGAGISFAFQITEELQSICNIQGPYWSESPHCPVPSLLFFGATHGHRATLSSLLLSGSFRLLKLIFVVHAATKLTAAKSSKDGPWRTGGQARSWGALSSRKKPRATCISSPQSH